MTFEKVAPFLTDDLVLTGFVLFLLFGFLRVIISSRVLSPTSAEDTTVILKRMITGALLITSLVIALAFGFRYKELPKAEQKRAVQAVSSELNTNRKTAAALAGNMASVLEAGLHLAEALRNEDVEILRMLFPWLNIEPNDTTPAASELSHLQLSELAASGLLDDDLQTNRFGEAAVAVVQTINGTETQTKSLTDKDQKRWKMRSTAYEANAGIFRRVTLLDMTDVQSLYADLERSREEYDRVMVYYVEYLEAVVGFLDIEEGKLDPDAHARALTSERQFFSIAQTYSSALEQRVKRSGKQVDELETIAERW